MDTADLVIWTLIWAGLWGAIAFNIGKRKGEPGLGFLCGFLLGPIGVLLALASKGNRVNCQFCKQLVDPNASICPHCQSGTHGDTRTGGRESCTTDADELLKLKQLTDSGAITQEEFNVAKARILGTLSQEVTRPRFIQAE